MPTRGALPAPVRRVAQGALRMAGVLGRRRALRRHLLRLRFGPWAPRWIGGRAVVAWRGVTVEVDPGEAHGFHVFVHGDYGGAETDTCIELCPDGGVFVDVGAHIGVVSLAVARACPGARVVAVEADPVVAAWFRRNLDRNPDLAHRVTLVEAAAAASDGDVPFRASDGPLNVGTGHVTTDTSAERVPAIALGPWLAARQLAADVVKVDVEGGELDALAGLWAAGGRPPALLVETHGHMFDPPDAFNRRVLAALERSGYDVLRLDRGRWVPVPDARDLGARAHLCARIRRG